MDYLFHTHACLKHSFHGLPKLLPLTNIIWDDMLVNERKNSRGKIEILADILFHCQVGLKKTHIMLRANLGYEQICYYLPNLIDTGLVMQVIDAGTVIYRTTESGREYLKNYHNIRKLITQQETDSTSGLIADATTI